jgi:hypothetical protein
MQNQNQNQTSIQSSLIRAQIRDRLLKPENMTPGQIKLALLGYIVGDMDVARRGIDLEMPNATALLTCKMLSALSTLIEQRVLLPAELDVFLAYYSNGCPELFFSALSQDQNRIINNLEG